MITSQTIVSAYDAEIKFLKRKLVLSTITWEARSSISQIISPVLSETEAKKLLADLKDVLGTKAGYRFEKLVFIVATKGLRQQQFRVAISASLLRQIFAGDIEVDSSGGGGRKFNPLRITPSPRP